MPSPSPFTPGSTVAFAASAGSSNRRALASGNGSLAVYNAGAVPVFVAIGDSSVTAAIANVASTTSKTGMPIAAGARVVLTPIVGATHIAGIVSTGSAKVYTTSGDGGL